MLASVSNLHLRHGKTRLGLTYGPGVPSLLESHPELIDYVELPFEMIRQTPGLASLHQSVPVVLHCASMSIAGFAAPAEATVAAIESEALRTRTPWIGEHLAFVSHDGVTEDSAPPSAMTYTMCPPLNEDTIERVALNLSSLRGRLPVPLILENAPQYAEIPGSTMTMTQFIAKVASRCDVDLLLDLSHFLITALNTGVDAFAELEDLPLDRVVEIHMSGMNAQAGTVWDDHTRPAPTLVFELLERVLRRTRPKAMTLEYNGSPAFPRRILLAQLDRARTLLERA